MPTSTTQRVIIGTVGLAVLGIGLSQIGQGPKLVAFTTNQPGILSGTGKSTDPITMSLSSDGTTITGTGSAGSNFVFNPGSLFVSYSLFGDGADGDCNYDGTTTVGNDAPVTPGGTENVGGATKEYLLTDWKFCNNATISSGVAVETLNPLWVKGTLTLNGIIHHNGCTPNSGTECNLGSSHGDWLQGSTPSSSANSGVSVFRQVYEADKSSLTNCAAVASGNGQPGNNGASILGCGGSSGGQCTGSVGSQVSPKATTTVSAVGTGDLLVADGYCSFLAGLNGACGTGSSGGGDGTNGASISAPGGGGAGWVVVHAYKITGSGSIQAKGGNGRTSTSANSCIGGGGGGGGGIITLVIGSGAYPTLDVSGGAGANGESCATCNGGGAGTGGKGGDGYQGLIKKWRLGLP